ncbi:DUF2442 domain-containing protein [Aureimonas glaciei]|uniref:DUF2442 domain-containing protein n=1 Tax=Aureimonas glaciei TaxID=1776957 RepID=A0A916V1K5_9HYPH|nr:DUF2442 domain-containing protein [Aureimonas glaciei]GGD02582.1 hypothetical protein GCM10011335_01610 [Aureimonas glaciei]
MAEFTVTDAMIEAARAAGSASGQPVPISARFDRNSGRIVVEFANGSGFMVPARALEGLEDATDDELDEVELLGQTGLHWESRDVDFRIAGLMAGIFGTARFMGRKGGQATSDAKGAAARRNGLKGGRPQKALP